MKIYQMLETPSGLGELRAGDVHLAQVFYQLQVREEIMSDPRRAGQSLTLGPLEVAGDITINPDEASTAQDLPRVSSGARLTLYLNDGRCFDVYALPSTVLPAVYHLVSAYQTSLVGA